MSRSYRFGEFRINPALRELWRGDRLVALPPLVFDCLTYLLEHHDRAVGRDELVAAVWGKADVSDTLLGQTILRIRRELGDDAKEQRILRTIPRFGYRWAAALEIEDYAPPAQPAEVSTPAPAAPLTSPAPVAEQSGVAARADEQAVLTAAADSAANVGEQPRPSMAKRALYALAALLLVAIVVWGVSTHRQPATARQSAPHSGSPVSAVLPAVVEPGAESWMRLGLMEAVAARLRSSGVPSVPSEDVVALLKAPAANRSATPREALGATLLVTPRVQHSGDDWTVGLDADDGAGRHYTADARSRDAATAARAAADKLLAALGKQPVDAKEESADAVLVRRIDAAALADDLDSARALFAQASPEQQRSPEVRLRLAKIDYRAGKYDAARERLVAMLDEAPTQTAPVLRASILNGLGAVANAREQSEQAAKYFDEAIPLLESRNEPEQLGQAYIGRAAAATDLGRFEAAAADYARARIAYRQANDVLALLRVAADEGIADYAQRRPGRALPQLEAATKGFTEWGALNEAILTSIYEIHCYLALLDGSAAMRVADAADVLAQRIDNRLALDRLRLARARALIAVGRLQEARGVLDGLRSAAGADPSTIAVAGAVQAQLELEAGNAAAAAALAERAVALLSTPNHEHGRAEAWLTLIRAEQRAAAAKTTTLSAFENWAARINDPRVQLYMKLAHAEQVRHDSGDWRHAFTIAGELAARDGIPFEVVAVARSYADALLAEGDLDAAAVEVGRVSRWSDQDFDCAVLEARLYSATGRNEARQAAVARARVLAGERPIPPDALSAPVSTRAARQ